MKETISIVPAHGMKRGMIIESGNSAGLFKVVKVINRHSIEFRRLRFYERWIYEFRKWFVRRVKNPVIEWFERRFVDE